MIINPQRRHQVLDRPTPLLFSSKEKIQFSSTFTLRVACAGVQAVFRLQPLPPACLYPRPAMGLSETTDNKANFVTYLPPFLLSLQIWTLYSSILGQIDLNFSPSCTLSLLNLVHLCLSSLACILPRLSPVITNTHVSPASLSSTMWPLREQGLALVGHCPQFLA